VAHLVLYDGVCGLCNRLVQFILRRDRADRFRFAPLQGALARDLLVRRGRNPDDLDTVYVVADHGGANERLLWKGRAIVFLLPQLGGVWRGAHLLDAVPTVVVDFVYDRVAKGRYRWFGRLDACPVPSARDRAKFVGPVGPLDSRTGA
jgi:predicted DCC family thiol-disulfide oxidoreductase YuxK